ncbi:MAG TPA: protein kinase, partial [Clostridia bacterium]|nr:protein kinase [Clostridia bacterium]
MDNYIGKKLDGRYEVQEIIGVGGMAVVYKAYDCIDDRTVAVKILKDEYLTNEEFRRRFKNESKAVAVLSHPNIVKVYDVSFGEKFQYIVMEFIDGITLKEYIDQQKNLTWKEALHFTVQILRALQHAHDRGIVHRDIKPQNIMMLEDGTIKVTDFGIARFAHSETRTMTDKAIGSVHYISPEQARGGYTDEKSDIYSVGVMLFEMLTGELPFEADSAVSVAIMQLQQNPKQPREINPDIPEGLEEITLRAMQKDPAQRYASASAMLDDIEEFKRNPSAHFEYKYFVDESPTKYVDAINKIKKTEEPEGKKQKAKKAHAIPILSGIAAALLLIALIVVFIALYANGY